MSNLTRFDNNGIELIINTSTGEVFATQGMIAKICKCESTQIRRFMGDTKTPQPIPIKDARGVTQNSILYNEDFIKKALAKYNPSLLLKCVDAA